jgi:hemerythrin-like domain-containing protein
MIIPHNGFLRYMNAIYNQGEKVEKIGSAQDILDFMGYALQWIKLVHEHHEGEESFVFPEIEKKAGALGIMDINIEQHQEFQPGMKAFEKYAQDVVDGREPYVWAKLRQIIDGFMPILQAHLYAEINVLLDLEQYANDWQPWYDNLLAQMLDRTNDPNIKVCPMPNGNSGRIALS